MPSPLSASRSAPPYTAMNTRLSAAIASTPATRATALFTPDAVPAYSLPTALITAVVSGATVMVMPAASTSNGGSSDAQ